MLTVFEVAPPIAIVTGTAFPFADSAGTSAFTWYSPSENTLRDRHFLRKPKTAPSMSRAPARSSATRCATIRVRGGLAPGFATGGRAPVFLKGGK